MNEASVIEAVHQVIKHIQSARNLKCPELTETTKPLKDLDNFTSPISLGATGMIGRKLGMVIPPATNVFGDKNGLYTLKKTVEVLCKLAAEQSKKKEPAKT